MDLEKSSQNSIIEEESFNEPTSQRTEPLWTVNDVARYLRLQPTTVRKMATEGKFPGIKVGRVWRFDPRVIKDWVGKQG